MVARQRAGRRLPSQGFHIVKKGVTSAEGATNLSVSSQCQGKDGVPVSQGTLAQEGEQQQGQEQRR
jgi:hypothetical protein